MSLEQNCLKSPKYSQATSQRSESLTLEESLALQEVLRYYNNDDEILTSPALSSNIKNLTDFGKATLCIEKRYFG